jgi:hypothetical protein
MFTADDYATLAAIVFRDDYPGNATARGVVEAPNGDGNLDATKKYSHVATKYVKQWVDSGAVRGFDPSVLTLFNYMMRAHNRAVGVACELGVPAAFLPSFEHGALRVLEYPAGAGSAVHTDFDLFTLNLYRNVENYGLGPFAMPVHMGELGELLGISGGQGLGTGGVGPAKAFPHFVAPLDVVQRSVVYFAIPDHAAVLPGGVTVGEWIKERITRSRVAM